MFLELSALIWPLLLCMLVRDSLPYGFRCRLGIVCNLLLFGATVCSRGTVHMLEGPTGG